MECVWSPAVLKADTGSTQSSGLLEHSHGWCCWAKPHIPPWILCSAMARGLTQVFRDQYWLKCRFPSRLKSLTLSMCKRGQRKAFLLYRYQEGFGNTWWQRTTCTFLYYSLALSLVLVLKAHCNGLFLVLSQESKWEVFSCLFKFKGKNNTTLLQ